MSLKHNSMWNLVGAGLPLLVGLAAIPYLVRSLGVEAFGILTLVWSLIGYFSLFDFGVGRALTQQIATRLGHVGEAEVPQLIKSGMLFIVAMGGMGAVLLAAISVPLAHAWLKISPSLESDTATCLLIAAIGIPFTTAATGFRGISEAYRDFKAISLLRMALGIGTFALPVICVWLNGATLPVMVSTLVAARVVACVVQYRLARRHLLPDWVNATRQAGNLRRLLRLSMWMTVSNIIGPIIVTMDRFVIATVSGAAVVAYYSVPAEIVLRLLIVPAALSTALFPQLATVISSNKDEAVHLYGRSLRVLAQILAPPCIAMAALSYPGLAWWIDPEFAGQSWPVASILSIGIFLNGLAYVPFSAIQAAGHAKLTGRINLFVLIVYVPILFLFVSLFGIIGAAIVWVARAGLDAVCLFWTARRLMAKAA